MNIQLTEKCKKLTEIPSSNSEDLGDWLVTTISQSAQVYRTATEGELVLTNGLISRTFRLTPNGATIGYDNLMTGESLIRGLKPEGMITLNGTEYSIGGLVGQVEYGYLLPEWLDGFQADPESFQLSDFSVTPIKERFAWKRVRHCEDRAWPPKGVELAMVYVPPRSSPVELRDLQITLHYECYEGISLFSKWLTVENGSQSSVRLNKYTNELLALVEFTSNSIGVIPGGGEMIYPHIFFETDYSFAQMANAENQISQWIPDQQYSSQVAYLADSKIMYESRLKHGPDVDIHPDGIFEGYREYQLVFSSYDRHHRGLAMGQMYRTIAPWVTENPIMMHLTSFAPDQIQTAIDQMEAVGFEMLIFSFGSMFNSNVLELGVDHPDWVDDMMEEIKEDFIDIVHKKGFDVGGYSLLASRRIGPEDDVVNQYTGKTSGVGLEDLEDGIEAIQGVSEEVANIKGAPTFGNSPCIGSDWGQRYFKSLYKTIEDMDLNILEHDGSYPGDICASTTHPGHRDVGDSQWTQWKTITNFYKWCRGRGVFLNVPDWFMLTGSNKTGIGYKEVNWSLPRDRQVMLGRQNIYDGTWEKCPTMGWTFTPLTQYHSVPEYPSEVATLEPLSEHLDQYESHLAQNFGCGVQACYRGLRLYDTEETKALVKKYVDWYKKYRPILDSDIVHIRRPDGRHIDGMLHVNPRLETKGLALLFNPTAETIREKIKIPLYYTGLTEKVMVSEREGDTKEYALDREYNVWVMVNIPPKTHTWLKFE